MAAEEHKCSQILHACETKDEVTDDNKSNCDIVHDSNQDIPLDFHVDNLHMDPLKQAVQQMPINYAVKVHSPHQEDSRDTR